MLGKIYQVTTYEEALEDVDVQEWKRAMEREMESMSSNSVWSLIEAPIGVKPIESKLICKKKSLGKPCVDVNVQEWKRVMDHEMESIGSNSIWSLIEAPKRVKPIGSKLIYKVNHMCIIDSSYSGSLLYSLRI